MSWENPNNEAIKSILESSKTIAVVGLSDDKSRTSYQIAKEMQDAGYNIIPINPMIDESLGEKSYASLADVNGEIDIINIFRRSEYLPAIAEEAAKTKATIFWSQQGVANQKAYDYLTERNFTVIMDMCIKVAHSILIKK